MILLIIIIVILIIIGFIKQIYEVNKFTNDYDTVKEYFNIFVNVINNIVNKQNFDNNAYIQLVKRSEEIQLLIGYYGLIDLAEAGRRYNNYPLVLNTIPKIKELKINDSFDTENILKELDMLQNGFLRYFNNLEIIINIYKKNFFNPFTNLKKGIHFILALPIKLLYWVGLINQNNKNKIENSNFISILSGIGTLLTLLSTIMSMFIDWNTFINTLRNLFSL